ncbi:hypothetical protein OUZ56_013218 [Daphnia magna]|uniref:Uncharacterized protein n=1 Tax=Daphnia magna TaxID=35525 RepID=A0ABQ9Z5B9_9CRUS|nr:hypothetical protein OUZ56_013218 [Daphnia magna]
MMTERELCRLAEPFLAAHLDDESLASDDNEKEGLQTDNFGNPPTKEKQDLVFDYSSHVIG